MLALFRSVLLRHCRLNPTEEELELEDEELIQEVAAYTCRARYCGHSEEDQRKMARLAAGLLPAAIVNRFNTQVKSEDREGSFTLYSAHDNTIMALLAHLGFKNFPIPQFAAYIATELHEIEGMFFVKMLYNPDPEFYGFVTDQACEDGYLQPCDYFEIPQDGVVDWEERVYVKACCVLFCSALVFATVLSRDLKSKCVYRACELCSVWLMRVRVSCLPVHLQFQSSYQCMCPHHTHITTAGTVMTGSPSKTLKSC
jgi:hypothetical protein